MLDPLRNLFRPKYCNVHSKTDIYCLNTCIKVVHRLQLMTTHTKQSLHPARSNALGPHFVLVPHRPEAETQVLILCQHQHRHQRSNTAPRTQRPGSWLRVLGLNLLRRPPLTIGSWSVFHLNVEKYSLSLWRRYVITFVNVCPAIVGSRWSSPDRRESGSQCATIPRSIRPPSKDATRTPAIAWDVKKIVNELNFILITY